jgi:hypothetical protein
MPSQRLSLRIGHGPPLAITADPLPDGATPQPLQFHTFRSGKNLSLKDGYYCPVQMNQETLDAFIYEAATQTAYILQSTVASHHSVKERPLTWLKNLGAKIFRYIAVTPPETQLDLPFPKSFCDDTPLQVYRLSVNCF